MMRLNLILSQRLEVILDSDEDNDDVVIICMGRVSKSDGKEKYDNLYKLEK